MISHSLHTSPQNSPNKKKVIGEVVGVTGQHGCALQGVEETLLWQVYHHDMGVGPGVWEIWEGGEQGVGAELEDARVVGAGPIQWA